MNASIASVAFQHAFNQSVVTLILGDTPENPSMHVTLGADFERVERGDGMFCVQVVNLLTSNIQNFTAPNPFTAIRRAGIPFPALFIRDLTFAFDPASRQALHTTRTRTHADMVELVTEEHQKSIRMLSDRWLFDGHADPYLYSVHDHQTSFARTTLRIACLFGLVDTFSDATCESVPDDFLRMLPADADQEECTKMIVLNVQLALEYARIHQLRY